MKNKIILFLLIIITVCSSVNVSAAYPHVTDNAGILSESEISAINELAEKIGSKNSIDIQILTVESYTGYSIQDYADIYYENHGFGYGSEKSGLILVLSMSERDLYISTQGSVLYITDGLSYDFLDEISVGQYGDGFSEFIYAVDDAVNNLESSGSEDGSKNSIIIGAVAGFIAATVTVIVMNSKMKTVRSNPYASDYIKSESFNLKESKDIFLFSNVTRTLRQTSNSSSGGGVHRSSSGTTHGGAHGKF